MRRPTRLDVANKAGVSPTTVSFVLNGRTDQGISERTRDLVLAVAAEMSYVPHAQARALRRGRSDIALVLLPALPPAVVLERMRSDLSRAFRAMDLTCIFAQITDPTAPLAELRGSIDPAVVLAMHTLPEAERHSLEISGIPLIDGLVDPMRSPAPIIDQSEIGEVQVRYLAERGHRVIGYGAIEDPLEQLFGVPRLLGAQRAAETLLGSAPIVQTLDYGLPKAERALDAWRSAGVTAVAVFNDLVAVAVLAACRSRGVRVPEDLAIIGVDDLDISAMQDPPLTSIALDPGTAVERVVAHVHQLVSGTTAPAPLEPVRAEDWISVVERRSA